VTRVVGQFGQGIQIPRIGQEIQVDHPGIGGLQDMMNKVSTDEPGAAGDEKGCHALFSLALRKIILKRKNVVDFLPLA
jgi:hypothetical protein